MNDPHAIVREIVEGVAAVHETVARLRDSQWRVVLARHPAPAYGIPWTRPAAD